MYKLLGNLIRNIFIKYIITCYRNRLESNAEHWNALLLSLQELIEWVIRKNAELESLGPMGGDTISLQKQLVGFFCFKLLIIKKRNAINYHLITG